MGVGAHTGRNSQPVTVSQSASGRWCSRDSQSLRAGHTQGRNLLNQSLKQPGSEYIYKYIHTLIPPEHTRTPEHCVCWPSEEIPEISGQTSWAKSWPRRRVFLCCDALNSSSPQRPAADFWLETVTISATHRLEPKTFSSLGSVTSPHLFESCLQCDSS